MYDLDIYYKKCEYDNMYYSVDMIRLKTYMTIIEFNELEFFIKSIYKNNIKKFWISDRIMNFHYNYVLEFEENSFFFGFLHNTEDVNYNKNDLKYNFTIEFNPNKIRDNAFIEHLFKNFGDWILKSFDLAVDIPINILDIVIDPATKRKFQTISYGNDNITHIIGSKSGRVKVYNKKNESSLNIVGNLTRVEMSIDGEDFPIRDIKRYEFQAFYFPQLYLNEYLFSFDDMVKGDKTLIALLYAVQHGYNIKDLPRVQKAKVKNMLKGGSEIKFDKKTATIILQQVIYSYFVEKESKQVIL